MTDLNCCYCETIFKTSDALKVHLIEFHIKIPLTMVTMRMPKRQKQNVTFVIRHLMLIPFVMKGLLKID